VAVEKELWRRWPTRSALLVDCCGMIPAGCQMGVTSAPGDVKSAEATFAVAGGTTALAGDAQDPQRDYVTAVCKMNDRWRVRRRAKVKERRGCIAETDSVGDRFSVLILR
jgi:hypothetical protein